MASERFDDLPDLDPKILFLQDYILHLSSNILYFNSQKPYN